MAIPGFSLPTTLGINMEVYVDYVRPVAAASLVRLPATLHFPSQNVGAPAGTQSVYLCNLGQADLHLTNISLPTLPFSCANRPAAWPLTIAPHGSFALQVVFSPPGVNLYNGQITVVSDDPLHPVQTVDLMGYGIPAGATDADNDGMPDAFELQYPTRTSTNALWALGAQEDDSGMDYDKDGFSNYAEYLAGTDPTDPQSHPAPPTRPTLGITRAAAVLAPDTNNTLAISCSTNATGFTLYQTPGGSYPNVYMLSKHLSHDRNGAVKAQTPPGPAADLLVDPLHGLVAHLRAVLPQGSGARRGSSIAPVV